MVSRGVCRACLILGIIVAAVVVIVIAMAVYHMLRCDGTGGCGIVFAFAPIVACYVFVPLGIISAILRYTFFDSRNKLIPADCLKMLRVGRRLLAFVPWVGILLVFVISFSCLCL